MTVFSLQCLCSRQRKGANTWDRSRWLKRSLYNIYITSDAYSTYICTKISCTETKTLWSDSEKECQNQDLFLFEVYRWYRFIYSPLDAVFAILNKAINTIFFIATLAFVESVLSYACDYFLEYSLRSRLMLIQFYLIEILWSLYNSRERCYAR